MHGEDIHLQSNSRTKGRVVALVEKYFVPDLGDSYIERIHTASACHERSQDVVGYEDTALP